MRASTGERGTATDLIGVTSREFGTGVIWSGHEWGGRRETRVAGPSTL
jgi:hypothetical protein